MYQRSIHGDGQLCIYVLMPSYTIKENRIMFNKYRINIDLIAIYQKP